MALSVKAYINPDTNQQEIRRFAIDEGASANFGYLRQKIEQVFPSVRGKAFKLFWKDADNEMITFSSDEELVEALGSFNGDVFRVYVKNIEGDQDASHFDAGETDDPNQAGPAHPGVVCDSCDKHIYGIRFKCVVCPNYDLCMTCETKGMHKEHEMLRIAMPRTADNNWFHGFNPFAFGHHPHHPPHGPPPHHPPHGPPPHGIPPIHFDFGHGFGPWGRGGRGRRAGGRGGRGGRCPKAKRCNSGGKKCDRHAADSNPGEVPVGPPFLHAVGESIASFLGPFGVEVHTYASNEPDCCQGKCQDETESSEDTAQAGPSGEPTGPPANDAMGESSPETSYGETSEMDVQPPEEFVLVDEKTDEPQQGGASATAADEGPTDPLEEAIAKMLAMGFEDDSGWLKQLITAKEFDLNKVLDAMQFEGKQ